MASVIIWGDDPWDHVMIVLLKRQEADREGCNAIKCSADVGTM